MWRHAGNERHSKSAFPCLGVQVFRAAAHSPRTSNSTCLLSRCTLQAPPSRKRPLPALGHGASTRSLRGQAAGLLGTRGTCCHSVSGSPSGCRYPAHLLMFKLWQMQHRAAFGALGNNHALFITQFFSFGKIVPDALLWPLDIRQAAPRCRHFLWPDPLGHTSKVRPARRAPVRWVRGAQLRDSRPTEPLEKCHSVTVRFSRCKDAPLSSCSSCLRGPMSLFCGSLEMTVSWCSSAPGFHSWLK